MKTIRNYLVRHWIALAVFVGLVALLLLAPFPTALVYARFFSTPSNSAVDFYEFILRIHGSSVYCSFRDGVVFLIAHAFLCLTVRQFGRKIHLHPQPAMLVFFYSYAANFVAGATHIDELQVISFYSGAGFFFFALLLFLLFVLVFLSLRVYRVLVGRRQSMERD